MKRSELLFSAITLPLDYIAVVSAALVAYFVRYLAFIQDIRPVIFDLPFVEYFTFIAAVGLVGVCIFAMTGLYSITASRGLAQEVSQIIVACTAVLAVVLAIMVFSRYLFDSRFIILMSYVFAIIFVGIERAVVRFAQRQGYKKGIGLHRVIVIGEGKIAQQLIEEIGQHPELGFRLVDQLPTFNAEVAEQLSKRYDNDEFDEIIQTNSHSSVEVTKQLVDFVDEHHITYRYTADLLDTKIANIDIKTMAGVPVIEVKQTKLDGWGRIYKRIFDIISSGLLIIVLSPVYLITAIAIILDTRGPVLFAYQRIGQAGKPFKYFKFRSMIPDAHKLRYDPEFLARTSNLREGTPMMKFKDDPRVTRVGAYIRRWSIDELPELFLVLFGKMSLVGPRPHEVEEVQKYQRHHKKVLNIKPGVTGLAQISGRSDLDFEDEVKLDTYYLENWSIALDFQILLKTPKAIINKRSTS